MINLSRFPDASVLLGMSVPPVTKTSMNAKVVLVLTGNAWTWSTHTNAFVHQRIWVNIVRKVQTKLFHYFQCQHVLYIYISFLVGDPYYDLEFNKPNTYHHSRIDYALPNMTEVTISFFLQSNYTQDYMTPFSYAVGDGLEADALALTDLAALTL